MARTQTSTAKTAKAVVPPRGSRKPEEIDALKYGELRTLLAASPTWTRRQDGGKTKGPQSMKDAVLRRYLRRWVAKRSSSPTRTISPSPARTIPRDSLTPPPPITTAELARDLAEANAQIQARDVETAVLQAQLLERENKVHDEGYGIRKGACMAHYELGEMAEAGPDEEGYELENEDVTDEGEDGMADGGMGMDGMEFDEGRRLSATPSPPRTSMFGLAAPRSGYTPYVPGSASGLFNNADATDSADTASGSRTNLWAMFHGRSRFDRDASA